MSSCTFSRRYGNIVPADASIGVIRAEMRIPSPVKGLRGFDGTLMFVAALLRGKKKKRKKETASAKMGILWVLLRF